MKCQYCGAEIGTNDKVCSSCGSHISYEMQKEQEQMNKKGCPRCFSTNVQFERENQGEIQEKSVKSIIHRTVGYCEDCGYTWYPDEEAEPVKRRLMGGRKIAWNSKAVIALAAVVAVMIIAAAVIAGLKDRTELLDWPAEGLSEMLPEPSSEYGAVLIDNEETFNAIVDNVSDEEYSDYVGACMERGFTVDPKTNTGSYEAYDSDGYRLRLSLISSMFIELDTPLEFDDLRWPKEAEGLVPAPDKERGYTEWESDGSFFLYVADMTIDEFNAYVKECEQAGFNLNYEQGEDYYYADNADGYHLLLNYEGNETVSVGMNAPGTAEGSK